MDEVDIALYSTRTRINADERHDHGVISQPAVVLSEILASHVLQDRKTEWADIKK
jgi:hypothetical protein